MNLILSFVVTLLCITGAAAATQYCPKCTAEPCADTPVITQEVCATKCSAFVYDTASKNAVTYKICATTAIEAVCGADGVEVDYAKATNAAKYAEVVKVLTNIKPDTNFKITCSALPPATTTPPPTTPTKPTTPKAPAVTTSAAVSRATSGLLAIVSTVIIMSINM